MNDSLLRCFCNNCEKGEYCIAEAVCYKSINGDDCKIDACYGCFNTFQELQCGTKSIEKLVIECCSDRNYCNSNLTIINPQNEGIIYSKKNLGFLIASSTILIILFIISIALVVYYIRKKRLNRRNILKWVENGKKTTFINNGLSKNTIHLLTDDFASNATTSTVERKDETPDFSSGSGPGELIQRTIARDIRIDYTQPIGQGRFGVVWKAKWNDDFVAVKSFFSMHECSWSRETDIYQTCMLRHENILGFIAADIKGNGHSVSMLLVTEYHPLGSLYDYLQENTLDYNLLKKFSYSIINGLNHLHTEIFSTQCKPAVAHRDLKSKNILVKSTLECCIADFGLAVRFNSDNDKLDVATNQIREGSQRYMAPECLNGCLNINSIDELKRADVYSYSLVLWELVRRYKQDELVESYAAPYSEYVSVEPSVEQMKDIVCDKGIRPTIIDCKVNNQQLEPFISIIKECWQHEPMSRLQSLRIKKYLNRLN